MKILQINSVFDRGSTGRIVKNLHNKINESGMESYVIYGRSKSMNSSKNVFYIGNKLCFYLDVIRNRIFDRHGTGNYFITTKIIRKIKKIDPDIIHLHNIHGYFINTKLLMEYIIKFNKRVVWTFHDCWPFSDHSASFEYPKIEGWNEYGVHKSGPKNKYPSTLFKPTYVYNSKFKSHFFKKLNPLYIITPSKWLSDLTKQSFFGEKEIFVINNTIDLNKFKPNYNNSKLIEIFKGKRVLLGVSNNWNDSKGLGDFINLSKIIPSNYQIVLVGVNKKIRRKIPKNIICIEKTESIEELCQYYTLAYAFVNPTYEDNYPTVNLEAHACGTPVIVYDTGGAKESASFGPYIVSEKGEQGLKKAIELLETMNIDNTIKKSYISTEDDFSVKYLELYKKIAL